MSSGTAYFERVNHSAFRATEHVSGAWNTREQHIAPALGLLAHVVELDCSTRGRDDLMIVRLSYDILGTVPVEIVETTTTVLRAGRTIELVEAALVHNDRAAVRLRAWLLQPQDTGRFAGTELPTIPPPDEMASWDPTQVWPGGFIASAEVRRIQTEPGRAAYWVRPRVPLIHDEPVSPLARLAGVIDIANGMTVRTDPEQVAFPNVDLTAHLIRHPVGDWIGFDTTVSFGPAGFGLTSSTLQDIDGPIGTVAQILTVRPTR